MKRSAEVQRDTENGDVFDELVIATRSTGRGPNGQVSMPDQGVTVATSTNFARISKILVRGPTKFCTSLGVKFCNLWNISGRILAQSTMSS